MLQARIYFKKIFKLIKKINNNNNKLIIIIIITFLIMYG